VALTVCGNSRCENGEQCVDAACASGTQCKSDCPLVFASCPVGIVGVMDGSGAAVVNSTASAVASPTECSAAGVCAIASGVCLCRDGYTGVACSGCAHGYLLISAKCVFMPGSMTSCTDGVRNGNEEGVDCGGYNCAQKCVSEPGLSVALMVGIATGILLAVFIVCYLAMCTSVCKCSEKKKRNSKLQPIVVKRSVRVQQAQQKPTGKSVPPATQTPAATAGGQTLKVMPDNGNGNRRAPRERPVSVSEVDVMPVARWGKPSGRTTDSDTARGTTMAGPRLQEFL
jgi:hypothetical protein